MAITDTQWLLRRLRPLFPLHLVVFLCFGVGSVLPLVDPLIFKWIIDDLLVRQEVDSLLFAAAIFLGAHFFRLVMLALGRLVSHYAGQRLVIATRLELFRHLQRLAPEQREGRPVGELLFRLEQDVGRLESAGSDAPPILTQAALTAAVTLLIMTALNWRLALLVCLFIPLMVLARRAGNPLLRAAAEASQGAGGDRHAALQEQLAAMDRVALLGASASACRRLLGIDRRFLGRFLRARAVEVSLAHGSMLLVVVATALVFGYGSQQVLAGSLSVGGLVAFYAYMNRLFEPINLAINLLGLLQQTRASVGRIRELLETPPLIRDRPGARPLPPGRTYEIQLDAVSFTFPGRSAPALHNLSLAVRPGERVAVVGASGSGKSTLAQLLVRQREPTSGRITLDGRDLRDWRLADVRRSVGYMVQDPVLFAGTLRENLLCGLGNADLDRLDQVMAATRLEPLLARWPEGLDQPLGARASLLSGGERQRVALARCLLPKLPLYLLDEATSALDAVTERELLGALGPLVAGSTVVVIAHRMAPVLWADRILVLDQGQLVGDGEHRRLFESNVVYRRLCDEWSLGEEAPAAARLSAGPEASCAGFASSSE